MSDLNMEGFGGSGLFKFMIDVDEKLEQNSIDRKSVILHIEKRKAQATSMGYGF